MNSRVEESEDDDGRGMKELHDVWRSAIRVIFEEWKV
jgi:hypothetical protein